MKHPEHIKIWARMQEARDKGDLETYYQLQDQHTALLTGSAMLRTDAEEPTPAPESDGIDWAKVAREAQAMVDLNKDAMAAWKKGQKASKAEQ